jgi:hypothetical protein
MSNEPVNRDTPTPDAPPGADESNRSASPGKPATIPQPTKQTASGGGPGSC